MYNTQKEMVKDIVSNMHSFLPSDLLKNLAKKPTIEIAKQYVEKSKNVKSAKELEELTDKFQKLIAQKVIIVILDHNKITNQIIKKLEIDDASFKAVFCELKGYVNDAFAVEELTKNSTDCKNSIQNSDQLQEVSKLDKLDDTGEVQKYRSDIFKIDSTVDIKKDLEEIKLSKENIAQVNEEADDVNVSKEKIDIIHEEEELFKKLCDKLDDKREEIKLNPKLIETILVYYVNSTPKEYQYLVENRGNILIREYLSMPHYVSMTEQCIEFEALLVEDVIEKLRREWKIIIRHPERILI